VKWAWDRIRHVMVKGASALTPAAMSSSTTAKALGIVAAGKYDSVVLVVISCRFWRRGVVCM
jgi:hypothetical protein